MMFAEATPTSLEIGGWLMILAAVAFGFNEIMKMVDRFGGKKTEIKQPLSVKEEKECLDVERHENFAAKVIRDHEALHSRIGAVDRDAKAKVAEAKEMVHAIKDGIKDSLSEMERRIIKASADGDTQIHERINELQESVGEIRGQLKQIDKHQS